MKHLAVDVTPHLKEVEGQPYIPWARALSLAGNPVQEVVTHPVTNVLHPIFGGAAVAIRQGNQECWLPVIDARAQPMPFGGITARDAGDALNRARARAVALVNGLGLGLYVDQPIGSQFVRALGVTSETQDLSEVKPITEEKKDDKKPNATGPQYVPWPAALAAAAITDPEFRWAVAWFDTPDDNGEMSRQPYARLPMGYMVAVDLSWRGRFHREYLPIMGTVPTQTKTGIKNLDHRTLTNPKVTDWHRAIMRCLAKGIAVLTGYGRSIYAQDAAAPAVFADSAVVEEIVEIATLLGIPIEAVLKKAGVPTIEAITPVVGERVLTALRAKRDANPPPPAELSDVQSEAAAKATTVVNAEPATPPVERSEAPAAATPSPTQGSETSLAPLLARIERIAAEKGIGDEMLRGFFGKPVTVCSEADLNRVLRALERAVPSASRKAAG